MQKYGGQILKTADIVKITHQRYPNLDPAWIDPPSHSLNHIRNVKYSCWCAFDDPGCQPCAIFERVRRGYYRVL
jgi:hypothetical protein